MILSHLLHCTLQNPAIYTNNLSFVCLKIIIYIHLYRPSLSVLFLLTLLWLQESKALSRSSGQCLDLALRSGHCLINSPGGVQRLIGL
jgi:hypothetical protein